jgi:thiol-disulfide isomerase/thioredoxin
MKLLDRIKTHYSRKTRLSLVFDLLFYLFILLMIIPTTRKKISSSILRITLHQPIFSGKPDAGNIYDDDLSWELISYSGERLSFSDLQEEVIFLNFWATWCPPCIAEMPSIQNLYNDYQKKVAFILVTHESQAKVKDFMNQNGYTLPVHSPYSQIPEIFDHRSIPTTFIISRSGEIVMRHKGAVNWNGKKIRRILDELIND